MSRARLHEVEGYGTRITLWPGESLGVAVNVAKAGPVSWKVFRIGWYGGAGAHLVGGGGPVTVTPQPPCSMVPRTARVECAWATAFTYAVPADAISGVYVIKLTTTGDFESYVPFVVVDGRTADVVMNVNVLSWQAYNDFDGESLYADASRTMPSGKAWEVSFDRPFANDVGAGRFFDWEADLVRFVESAGYDVSYTTGIDLGHDATQVSSAKLFVSAANDEYWTVAERRSVEQALAKGVHLAFLGADQVLWRVRLEPSAAGVPERVVVCYKADQDRDPMVASVGPSASTARFREDPDPHPENALIGVMYDGWMLTRQSFVVANPSAWMFEGTGLQPGDAIPLAAAAEYDTRFANGAEPAGLTTLAVSPVVSALGRAGRAMATTYTAASGAQVIGIASIGFANGLGFDGCADSRVARITRNLFDRLGGHAGLPDPPNAPWASARLSATIVGAWGGSVATVAGGPNETTFDLPAAVAVAPDGTAYVAEPDGNVIRAILPANGGVTTVAGSGLEGLADGPGGSARFRGPIGLAVGGDGTLFIADSGNNVIRAVAPDAARTVSTWAGVVDPSGGYRDGPGAQALFKAPVAVAVAPDGAVLVAEIANHRIRRIDPGPAHAVTTLAGSAPGYLDGPGATAQLNSPSALTVAPDGTVYVLDTFNQVIRRVANDAARTVTTIAGTAGGNGCVLGADGSGAQASFGAQNGIAFVAGRVYVSDVATARIRVITPGADATSTTVATYAGGQPGYADGAANQARFALPIGLAAGPNGELWLADAGNRAVRVVRR